MGADPFALLEAVPHVATDESADAAAVGGGWFGYLGYALGSRIERLDPPPPPGGPELPPFSLAFYDHLLHLDSAGRWWFEALVTEVREPVIRARLDDFRNRIPESPASCPSDANPLGATGTVGGEASRGFSTEPWRATPAPAGHGLAVAACRERIRAGDLFQANICQRLSSRLSGDPLDLFVTGAHRLKPDRAAYLAGPWGAVASFSPELFLERRGARVRTAPIKGTRPRPANDPAAAEAHRLALAASAKDRAENQMIVDMARNDLGRVCSYGSIEVAVNAEARAHTGVWHLVSEVTGCLHEGRGDADLLRATFPPASVTGAPKIAAENVIAELESTRREIYTGAIGFVSPLAGLELSVAIRSFEFGPVTGTGLERDVWLGVGGGIVADSDPGAEAEECRTKSGPLLEAIDAEVGGSELGQPEGGDRPPAITVRPLRVGSRPLPRPDPARGIFETILVEDGCARDLQRHLARMAVSAKALFGSQLPAGLGSEIEAAAKRAVSPGSACRMRLRVDLDPDLTTRIRVTGLAHRRQARLAPVCLPGGLGPHKWADRTLIDSLAAAVAPHIPLLCDLDGYVLEAAHANVVADLGDGRLVTPALDGRILPGTARARLVAGEIALPPGLSHTVETPIRLARLHRASAIYLVNSLSDGLRRAHIIDGS